VKENKILLKIHVEVRYRGERGRKGGRGEGGKREEMRKGKDRGK